MHGRPRAKKGAPEDPEKLRKQKQRAALYGKLTAEVLGRRAAGRHDAESLTLSARLLEMNPELYTVWNYRREALGPVLTDAASDTAREAVAVELALTLKALHVNPKSYAAWHHRGWVVDAGSADLQAELALVQRLLSLDDRNFHGWAYWRWLVARARLPPEECLAFTAAKLRENFSNYSAWHARSTLLASAAAPPPVQTLADLLASGTGSSGGGSGGPGLQSGAALPPPAPVPQAVLDSEFDLVHKAFWTEPRDQSAWLYHRWLLGSCLAAAGVNAGADDACERATAAASGGGGRVVDDGSSGSSFSTALARDNLWARLDAEASMCRELLEEEPKARWPLLTLARVQEAQVSLQQHAAQRDPTSTTPTSGEDQQQQQQQQQPIGVDPAVTASATPAQAAAGELYNRLEALDSMRAGYYRDAAAGRARVVLRAADAAC